MGVFAIAGIPPLAGFFSKDEILYRTFSSRQSARASCCGPLALVTAGMTSFYMFRLWFKTFFGEPALRRASLRLQEHGARCSCELDLDADDGGRARRGQAAHPHGVHESPWIMLLPLVVLAILSIVGGWVGVPQALGGHNAFRTLPRSGICSGVVRLRMR